MDEQQHDLTASYRATRAAAAPVTSSRPRGRRGGMFRALLGDTRGAAFAEAVVLIPFFIIVWASILYVHDYYTQKILTAQRSRNCAWRYAVSGCRDSGGCTGGTVINEGAGLVMTDLPGGDAVTRFASNRFASGVFELVLGRTAMARDSATVPMPRTLGTSGATARGRHSVMCNEVPRAPPNIVYPAYCLLSWMCI